jgi:release factor glutamine methyltransferase
MPTIHDRVATARETLRRAGLGADEAELSARMLAEHVLGWDAARYFTLAEQNEPTNFADQYERLVSRRAAREPSAYIRGHQEFWGLELEVSPAVLIPRPETELIVEAALAVVDRSRPLQLVDACTGCGCVAIALARELPHASIVATDISDAALEIARRNARRHGVADRVRFVRTSVLEGLDQRFDVVTANPPYVKRGDGPALQPEVREYEPAVALYGGDSGLDLVTAVVRQAVDRLRPSGFLIFEFGFGQEVDVEQIIAATADVALIELRRDLRGLARTAVARRS